jgi:Ser/Thr protein kinase RdoA (MazF antagonist)
MHRMPGAGSEAWFNRFRWDFDCMVGTTPRWGRWQDGIGVGPAEADVLGRAAALMEARLRRFGSGPDRFGLIHADMRLANLLVSGPDIAVIDFDDCGFGWFLFDIGASLSFIEHDPRVPALTAPGCAATGEADLPAATPRIPTFVLLRRLQLVAWVGSHVADAARELGADFTTARVSWPSATRRRRPPQAVRLTADRAAGFLEMIMFSSMKGRSVLVVYGAEVSGIAVAFAAEGAQVVITGRDRGR